MSVMAGLWCDVSPLFFYDGVSIYLHGEEEST